MNSNKEKIKKIGIIIIIMVLIIGYFIYQRKNEFTIKEEELSNENTIKEPKEEKSKKIIVHISGAVKQEGVVELEENSRIADAIEKVGGLKENAETKEINLAYKLEDGMKIYVPTKEEIQNKESQEANKENQYVYEGTKENQYVYEGTKENNSQRNSEEKNISVNKKVNINKASQEELDNLPGIGPSTASKILEYRKQNGNFKNIEDIKEVSGIGEAKFEKIKEMITVN